MCPRLLGGHQESLRDHRTESCSGDVRSDDTVRGGHKHLTPHTSDLTLHTSHHFIVGEQPAGRGGGEDHGLHGGDQGEEEGQ